MMKVYRVVKAFYDGDHIHGQYESPFFARRQDAEQFRAAVTPGASYDPRHWVTDDGLDRDSPPVVEAIQVVEVWDGTVHEARVYLGITYT